MSGSLSGTIDPDLLALLVCPLTRGPLAADGDWLLSTQAGVAYPIVDGVPRLHDGAAVPLDDMGTGAGGR